MEWRSSELVLASESEEVEEWSCDMREKSFIPSPITLVSSLFGPVKNQQKQGARIPVRFKTNFREIFKIRQSKAP